MTKRFEILVHGPEHSQFFQGCGVSFSSFKSVVTGIGENAKEAYADCVDQIYTLYGSKAEGLRLPSKPRGIRASDRLSQAELGSDEYHYYVSIRFTVNA
jgi:hypothetical protein